MALNYVQITGSFDDGSGVPPNGNAVFTPSSVIYSVNSGALVVSGAPIVCPIVAGRLQTISGGTLQLLATDNVGLKLESLTGFWYWNVSLTLSGDTQQFQFFLPHSPSSVDLYSLMGSPAGLIAYPDTGRTATVIVAATNSTTVGKENADFVCTGTADEVTINNAINSLPGVGGRVVLLEGTYTRSSTGSVIINSSQVILEGQGTSNTTIACLSSGMNSPAAIIIGNTQTVNQSGVKNLGVNNSGGTGSPVSGSGHGIVLAVNGGVLENVIVQYANGDGFHIGQDLVQFTTGTTTIAALSNGNALPQTTINVASTSTLASSGAVIIETASGPAYIQYTGTNAGTQLTGCTCSFPTGASLATGNTVTQVSGLFDLVAVNCYSQFHSKNGWYVDWTYGSCEFYACKANSGITSTKPTNTGTTNGFLLYGTQLKFFGCHAFFGNQYGMQIGDVSQFTAGPVTIVGGEWESNLIAGIFIRNNAGPITIDGAQFYGSGQASNVNTGLDLFLSSQATGINITNCVFRKTPLSNIGKNIYMFSASYVRITGCEFQYQSIAQNVFVDGATGACDHIFIRNNRMKDNSSGSDAVLLKGATTFCEVSGNVTDASIVEQASGSTPNNNTITDNTLVPGQSATITIVGALSREYNNEGFSGSRTAFYPTPDWFNVVAYGADPTGTNDSTTAINNAITAAAAAGSVSGSGSVVNNTVYFPAGVYKTSGTLSLSGDAVTLRGSGWGSIIRPASSSNFDVISTPIPGSSGTSGFTRYYIGIRDLMIDCTNMTGTTAGQGNAIHTYGMRYSEIERVYIINSPNWAILLDGDSTPNFSYDNIIRDCIFDLCAGNVRCVNGENHDVVNSRFKWCGGTLAANQPSFGTQDTVGYHLRLSGGYCGITGNVIGNGGSYTSPAILMENSGPGRVIGNRFDQPRAEAIKINSGTQMIIGNQIGNPGSAVANKFGIQVGSAGNTIIGNVFDLTNGAANYTYCIGESGGPFAGNVYAGNILKSGTSGLISTVSGSTGRILANGGTGYFDANETGLVTTTSSSYAAGTTDSVILVNCSTAAAVTLTGAATQFGRQIVVKDISGAANTNNITVSASGGTVDGASSVSIGNNYGSLTLVSDGTAWYTIPPIPGGLTIDGTASDIQADGSQAAGSTGKAADAGHVHPEGIWTMQDQGLIAQTFDMVTMGSATAPATGTVILARLRIPQATTITNILVAGTEVASPSVTSAFFGLYNSSGTLVASTANRNGDTLFVTSGTSSVLETAPLSSTYSAAAGFYWVGVLWVGSTLPQMGRLSEISGAVVNAGLAAGSGNLRMATYSTGGQTSLPGSFTPTSQMNADNHGWWAGLN